MTWREVEQKLVRFFDDEIRDYEGVPTVKIVRRFSLVDDHAIDTEGLADLSLTSLAKYLDDDDAS